MIGYVDLKTFLENGEGSVLRIQKYRDQGSQERRVQGIVVNKISSEGGVLLSNVLDSCIVMQQFDISFSQAQSLNLDGFTEHKRKPRQNLSSFIDNSM